LPSAISICAVTVTFSAQITLGVHPRASWAARSPESTANSKALKRLGRCTTGRPFCVNQESGKAIGRRAARADERPREDLLACAPSPQGFGEGWAETAEGSEKQRSSIRDPALDDVPNVCRAGTSPVEVKSAD
jgi:hypothetical protein